MKRKIFTLIAVLCAVLGVNAKTILTSTWNSWGAGCTVDGNKLTYTSAWAGAGYWVSPVDCTGNEALVIIFDGPVTGGNNAYRNLAVTTYAASCDQNALDGFQAPTDIHDNHIYVSLHNYNPYNFCNDNSGINPDGTTYDYNIRVFDNDCKAEIDDYMSRTSARFNRLGLPYIFGEFGAIDANKDMGERVKYANYVATQMKKYNTTGLWWMGLYDRSTHEWYEEEIVDALKAILGK